MKVHPLLGLIAVIAIASALWHLHRASSGIQVTETTIGGTPARIYRPASGKPLAVVVIAHGFAGSQTLMQSFALTFARNGYAAVTFDFAGHGRNPAPLTGSIIDPNGATRSLVTELSRVAGYARSLGDGRLAVLGHSMASDIVVRFAESAPDVFATIAVSLFSPAVTATAPSNLLIIVGDWESTLKREALRAVGLASAPWPAQPGVTYGSVADGTGRRTAFSAHVEHASVLFSQDSMREALAWLDASLGVERVRAPMLDDRGPWILLLIAGVVVLARPLAALLPRLARPALGAGLPWRQLWQPLLLPMLVTPLILRVLPTHFLPVLVGDYLAAHFALYGLLTGVTLWWRMPESLPSRQGAAPSLGVTGATLGVVAFGFLALVWPLDIFVTSFIPGPQRLALIFAMLAGTLLYFLSDEWLTRGTRAGYGAYAASKLAFLLSLGLAVALDLERLFFLVIIVPVIVLFFIVYGLFSRWIYEATGHPFVAGMANAVAFAWAIGVTFPLLTG